jgi:hypothetical protein
MTKRTIRRRKVLGLISVSLIIASVSYGFAQANSATPTSGILSADYGVVSPYQVTRIQPILDLEDPSTFTAVEFRVKDASVDIAAAVSPTRDGQLVWADKCENSGQSWTCSFDQSQDVLQADWLHVLPAN